MCRALNLGIVEFRKQCTYTHVYMREGSRNFKKLKKEKKKHSPICACVSLKQKMPHQEKKKRKEMI